VLPKLASAVLAIGTDTIVETVSAALVLWYLTKRVRELERRLEELEGRADKLKKRAAR
jgi:prefoldin subunit 5